MDITRALKFAFKDPEWFKKFCIGVGVLLVPIVSFAWYGYLLETARGVTRGDERLPEWSPFGKYFQEGFVFGISRLIYFIPLYIVMLGVFSLTPMIFNLQVMYENPLLDFSKFFFVVIAISAFSMLYQFAFLLIQPELVENYLQRNSFGSLFEWQRFWNLFGSNQSQFLKASGYSIVLILLGKVIQIGLQILLSFMPGIGNIFAALGAVMATLWAELAIFHLYGELHAELIQAE